MHCPLLKAFNRFQFSSSRKNFARFVLFVFLVYFLLNINGISDWVKGLTQGQHQGKRAFTYANLHFTGLTRRRKSRGTYL